MLVDVARRVRVALVEHRPEHAVLAGQRAEGRDQLVAHPRGEEAAEAAHAVGQAERRVVGAGELAGAVDEALQDLVDRELGGDAEHSLADRPQRRAEAVLAWVVVHSGRSLADWVRAPTRAR